VKKKYLLLTQRADPGGSSDDDALYSMTPLTISASKYTNIDFEYVNISVEIELEFSAPKCMDVFSRSSRKVCV
jgi:hypothetical protein